MKKHILILFLLSIVTLSAFGQAGSLSQSVYRSRVNDSTAAIAANVAPIAAGYAPFFWNNQATTPGWRVWNGTSYDIGFSSGGNFWKNAGTTTLTGMPIIDGATNDLSFENIGNFSTETLSEIYFGPGTDFRVSATEKASITAADSINFTAPIIKLGGQVGTTGQVPTINASGVLKYATPSGGGSNIYNADGTLTAARTLTGGGFDLTMSGMSSLTADATGDINFLSSGASVVLQSATIAITDAATMDITDAKHTLTTSSATRTFTQSFNGDFASIVVTLNTTASVFTFPAGALCVSEGLLSGDNTLSLSGTSGDKYFISIAKYGSAYYVVCKSFGQ